MTVAGIVLAAGAGRRFSASGGVGAKQRASVGGVPIVAAALGAAVGAGLDAVVLVQGATDLSDLVPAGVIVLDNPRWDEGLATSLQVALDHAREAGHDAVIVGLGDQPGVRSESWRAVALAAAVPPIAVATYGGRRGNPVRLHRSVWDLVPTTGDEGARAVMQRRPDLVREIPCSGDPHDVDTLEDLDRWS